MTEQLEYNADDIIVIADQTSLIETLVKNLAILRTEIRHCMLIDSEFEANNQLFKELTDNLQIKIQSLTYLSEQLDDKEKNRVMEFSQNIHRYWRQTSKQINEEFSTFFVASRTIYGVALTSLLNEIKNELTAVKISLEFGEFIYDKEYVIKGHMYCSELTKLLNTLEGCDEKVQQYLMISKIINHLRELDMMIDQFAMQTNLVLLKNNNCEIFSNVSKLLTGELLGWQPVCSEFILRENTPKKPIFITKNSKRTQLKSLQHLPLFH